MTIKDIDNLINEYNNLYNHLGVQIIICPYCNEKSDKEICPYCYTNLSKERRHIIDRELNKEVSKLINKDFNKEKSKIIRIRDVLKVFITTILTFIIPLLLYIT